MEDFLGWRGAESFVRFFYPKRGGLSLGQVIGLNAKSYFQPGKAIVKDWTLRKCFCYPRGEKGRTPLQLHAHKDAN